MQGLITCSDEVHKMRAAFAAALDYQRTDQISMQVRTDEVIARAEDLKRQEIEVVRGMRAEFGERLRVIESDIEKIQLHLGRLNHWKINVESFPHPLTDPNVLHPLLPPGPLEPMEDDYA